MVRSLLNGRLANSAGVIFAPDGKTKLTRSGRHIEENYLDSLSSYAKKYPAKAKVSDALIPDFKYFKMALATASSEQRLLLVVSRPVSMASKVQKFIAPVVWDKSIQGKFHIDVESSISKHKDLVKNLRTSRTGSLLVIETDEYGMEGKVIKQLSFSNSQQKLIKELSNCYDNYMKGLKVKSYSSHVREGKRDGVYLDLPTEIGEDRDGDGKIDENNKRRFEPAKEKAKRSGTLIKVDK